MIANAGAFNSASGDSNYEDGGTGHRDGSVYLQGYWHAGPQGQAMVSGGNDGSLSLHYHPIQVVVVTKPETGGPIRVNVTQDGKPIDHEDAGNDIHYDSACSSYVSVDAARAYEVVMNAHFGQHDLRLLPLRFGLGVHSFAFESCEVPAQG
jgi:hypothetical protein